MEPITISLIIITLVVSLIDAIVNIHSSIKNRHLESDCGCCSFLYDSDHKDEK